MFTEFNIESSVKVQDIDSSDISHDVSFKIININIIPCCSECNWQFICCWEDEFYYDSVHKIKTFQHIAFISAIILFINGDLKNLYEIMICEDWLLFQNAINQEISLHWKCFIYEKVSQSSISAEALLLLGQ